MKHTGYTPGPWGYAEGVSGDLLVWSGNRHVATAYRHTADAVLIADAPRLAEENERLREALRAIMNGDRSDEGESRNIAAVALDHCPACLASPKSRKAAADVCRTCAALARQDGAK